MLEEPIVAVARFAALDKSRATRYLALHEVDTRRPGCRRWARQE